jgi:hypothetical protein
MIRLGLKILILLRNYPQKNSPKTVRIEILTLFHTLFVNGVDGSGPFGKDSFR